MEKNRYGFSLQTFLRGNGHVIQEVVPKSHGKMVPVPNNLTSHFQPLDLTTNTSSKSYLKKKTHEWFSAQVQMHHTTLK